MILFGSPKHGLEDILRHEQLKMRDLADNCINVFPAAATRTIRLEEALMIALFLARREKKSI